MKQKKVIFLYCLFIALLSTNPGVHASLFQAIKKGDVNEVEQLLKQGEKPNQIGYRRRSPLHIAMSTLS